MNKRVMGMLLMLGMLIFSFGNAFAENITMTVKGPDGTEEIAVDTISKKTYRILKSGEYTFTQSNPNTRVLFRISADASEPEGEITIRFNGVNFESDSEYSDWPALYIGKGRIIRIVLEENTINRLYGVGGGIKISNTADVVIEGKGTLYATGGSSYRYNGYSHTSYYYSGIEKGTGDNYLIIKDGTIYATGAELSAGIGAGYTVSHGAYGGASTSYARDTKNISIMGGTVIASGGRWAPAIGGSYEGRAQNLFIDPAARTTIYAKSSSWEEEFTQKTDITDQVKVYNALTISSIVSPCPHDGKTEIRGAVEPTYESTGYTGDTYCLECDAKIADGKTIPALSKHTLPQTGDNSHITLWLALLMLTGTATLILKRKTA